MAAAEQHAPDPFEVLIERLNSEGFRETADRVDEVRHRIAWTTGTELLGELGLALQAFKRQRPRVSPELRRQLKACLRLVRRAWPGPRFFW